MRHSLSLLFCCSIPYNPVTSCLAKGRLKLHPQPRWLQWPPCPCGAWSWRGGGALCLRWWRHGRKGRQVLVLLGGGQLPQRLCSGFPWQQHRGRSVTEGG